MALVNKPCKCKTALSGKKNCLLGECEHLKAFEMCRHPSLFTHALARMLAAPGRVIAGAFVRIPENRLPTKGLFTKFRIRQFTLVGIYDGVHKIVKPVGGQYTSASLALALPVSPRAASYVMI